MLPIDLKSSTVEKVLDIIANACGKLYEPIHIKKMARAKSYEIQQRAEAEAKADIIKLELESGEARNLFKSIYYKEFFERYNFETIVGKSIGYLKEKRDISPTPVDLHWTLKFYDHAKFVTDDELKETWARILAEEVAAPGSVSPITLSILANLDKETALLFQKLATVAFEDGTIFYPQIVEKHTDLSYEDILRLRFNQLLYESGIQSVFQEESEITFGQRKLQASAEKKVPVPSYCLTPSGVELFRVIEVESNYEYLEDLIEATKGQVTFQFIE